MDDIKTQQLLEKFKKLPQHMKEAIVSTDIDNAVLDIAKKHGLLLTEAGQLDNEIVLVLIGEKQASDFIKNIEKEIELSKDKALAVGKDVNEMIFEKVRAKMKEASTPPTQAQNEPVQKPEPETASAPSPQTKPVPPNTPQPGPADISKAETENKKVDIQSTQPVSPEPSPQKETSQPTEATPESSPEKSFLKENIGTVPEQPSPVAQPVKKEGLVDKKLNEQTFAPKTESGGGAPEGVADKKKPESGAPDPYREPIE